MQDAVVRAIIVQSKKLADIAMESRPTADRGSVEVGASVALLIVAIHIQIKPPLMSRQCG